MLNISIKTNKKFILKNCLLLSTVCFGLLISENVNAEFYGKWETPYGPGGYPKYLTGDTSKNVYLAETDDTNTFTKTQTFTDLTFSTEGSATVNTISTNVSSSSTDNELITATSKSTITLNEDLNKCLPHTFKQISFNFANNLS